MAVSRLTQFRSGPSGFPQSLDARAGGKYGDRFRHLFLPGVTGQNFGSQGAASNMLTPPGASGTSYEPSAGGILLKQSAAVAVPNVSVPAVDNYPWALLWVGRVDGTTNSLTLAGLVPPSGSRYYYLAGQSTIAVNCYLRPVNFGTPLTLGVVIPGGLALGVLLAVMVQSRSATDHTIYSAGAMANDTTNLGIPVNDWALLQSGSISGNQQSTICFGFSNCRFTDAEALELTADPICCAKLLFE